MSQNPPTETERQRWIVQWRAAAAALARIKADELRKVDLSQVAVQLEDACRWAIERDPPKPRSGLIEQQRLFHP